MAWPIIIDDDGTGTTGTPIDKALFDAIKGYIDVGWVAYTPTWYIGGVAIVALGDYELQGIYTKRANDVTLQILLKMGTSALPGGNWELSLPPGEENNFGLMIGYGLAYQPFGATYAVALRQFGVAGRFEVITTAPSTNALTPVNQTTPLLWAPGYYLHVHAEYRSAHGAS